MSKDSTKQLAQINNNIQKRLQEKVAALPKGFNRDRFLHNAMAVLKSVPNIEKFDPVSVAQTMFKGAVLNLDFFSKECYAIPYGNELKFQEDYKGLVKIIKQFSIEPVETFYTELVREGDYFKKGVRDGKQFVEYEEKAFSNGKIIGTFAVCLFKNGTLQCESMSIEEVHHIRDKYSKKKDNKLNPSWIKSEGEMTRKVVSRRLSKHIPKDFNQEQSYAYEDGGDSTFEDTEIIQPEPVIMPKPIERPPDHIVEQANQAVANPPSPPEAVGKEVYPDQVEPGQVEEAKLASDIQLKQLAFYLQSQVYNEHLGIEKKEFDDFMASEEKYFHIAHSWIEYWKGLEKK